MKGNRAVVGVFSYLDDTLTAIRAAQSDGRDVRVYSPVPLHEIEELTYPQKSPVRLFSYIGGVTGLSFGFFMAIMCALDYPLRTSAKDIVSIPAFVVIGYECTILFGAIFTLLAVFHFCRLPDVFRKVGYDPRFSRDKFGVVVGCDNADVDAVGKRLKSAGAEDVIIREAL
jgi:molybdopterin-containing oxidoreductase family membrane subunit